MNCIFRARVPIIAVLGGENDSLDMDISVHALHNFGRYTVLALRLLGQIDARVRELILAIKTWAQRRRINEAFRGTLNSFSLILMVVFLLQNVEPPILPNIFNPVLPLRGDAAARARRHLAALQGDAGSPRGVPAAGASAVAAHAEIYRNLKGMPEDAGGEEVPVLVLNEADTLAVITGVDGTGKAVRFHDSAEALRGWGSDNTQSVSELLVRFFAFYATEVSWASECISVRHGQIISVPRVMAPAPHDPPRENTSAPPPPAAPLARRGHAMFIEDCLDDSNNVARCVDDKGLARIHDELVRAWTMLCGRGDLEAVFQRFEREDEREGDPALPTSPNRTFPVANVSSLLSANPSSRLPALTPSPLTLLQNGSQHTAPLPMEPLPSPPAAASRVDVADVEGVGDTRLVGESSEVGGDGEHAEIGRTIDDRGVLKEEGGDEEGEEAANQKELMAEEEAGPRIEGVGGNQNTMDQGEVENRRKRPGSGGGKAGDRPKTQKVQRPTSEKEQTGKRRRRAK